MKSPPTMLDVARAAHCSRSTVSLALRDDRSIPEKTRQRVRAAAQRLGYRTNPMVAALMSIQRRGCGVRRATPVIAYLTSHTPDNPWRQHAPYVGMHGGALERGTELGYKLEEFSLGSPRMTPKRMREILRARNIHTVVVAPLPFRTTQIEFDFSSFAVVGLGMSVHRPAIERVANDHFQSAVLAVARCVELGYRRIGFVLSQETSQRLDHRWLAGYRFAVDQHGLVSSIPALMTERADELSAAMPGWQRQHRPDVVMLDNSHSEQSKKVPLTVGIVSLAVDRADDPITGIYQDYALLGRVAVEHATAKLYTNNFGLPQKSPLHLLAGTWVVGATTPGPGRRRPDLS